MKKLWLGFLIPALLAGCAGIKSIPVRNYHGAFLLKEEGLATARVLNAEGQEVQVLFKDKALSSGPATLTWDGREADGKTAPAGTYALALSIQTWDLKPVGHFGGLGSTPGRFLNPQGLCAYPQGSRLTVAVADTGNQRVQLLTDTGGFLQAAGQFGVGNEKLNQPTDVAWDGQILTVCDSQNRRLARFDDRGSYLGEVLQLTGLQTSLSNKVALEFHNPASIQKGGGGDFWVSDSGQGILFHVTSTGGILEEWGNTFPLNLDGPFLQIGGNTWVKYNHNQIQVLNSSGNELDSLKLDPGFKTIGGMAAGANFALVSDSSQGLLYFLDPDGKVFKTISPQGVSQPSALALWEDQLFLIDASVHEIAHFQLVPKPLAELHQTVKVEDLGMENP